MLNTIVNESVSIDSAKLIFFVLTLKKKTTLTLLTLSTFWGLFLLLLKLIYLSKFSFSVSLLNTHQQLFSSAFNIIAFNLSCLISSWKTFRHMQLQWAASSASVFSLSCFFIWCYSLKRFLSLPLNISFICSFFVIINF